MLTIQILNPDDSVYAETEISHVFGNQVQALSNILQKKIRAHDDYGMFIYPPEEGKENESLYTILYNE